MRSGREGGWGWRRSGRREWEKEGGREERNGGKAGEGEGEGEGGRERGRGRTRALQLTPHGTITLPYMESSPYPTRDYQRTRRSTGPRSTCVPPRGPAPAPVHPNELSPRRLRSLLQPRSAGPGGRSAGPGSRTVGQQATDSPRKAEQHDRYSRLRRPQRFTPRDTGVGTDSDPRERWVKVRAEAPPSPPCTVGRLGGLSKGQGNGPSHGQPMPAHAGP